MSSVRPKKTPLPTEVNPTMKPPQAPISTAATRSRLDSLQPSSPAAGVRTRLFATSPTARRLALTHFSQRYSTLEQINKEIDGMTDEQLNPRPPIDLGDPEGLGIDRAAEIN